MSVRGAVETQQDRRAPLPVCCLRALPPARTSARACAHACLPRRSSCGPFRTSAPRQWPRCPSLTQKHTSTSAEWPHHMTATFLATIRAHTITSQGSHCTSPFLQQARRLEQALTGACLISARCICSRTTTTFRPAASISPPWMATTMVILSRLSTILPSRPRRQARQTQFLAPRTILITGPKGCVSSTRTTTMSCPCHIATY